MKKGLYAVTFAFLISFTFVSSAFAAMGDNATQIDVQSGYANFFTDIASSSNGEKLVAVSQSFTNYNTNPTSYGSGVIYTSTNSGASWTSRSAAAGQLNWNAVASSSDGAKLVAAVYGGKIYTSANSGASWTSRDTDRGWVDVASSSDGTKLVAAVFGGRIYTSANSGASWTTRDTDRDWNTVASSSDGSKLVATVANGQIYTSTDSGASWTARDANRNWVDVASSSDGTKLVAAVFGGQIYTSTDSGASWTARDSTQDWHNVASSSDGSVLYASIFYWGASHMYTSVDYGVTWRQLYDLDSTFPYEGIATSQYGEKFYAASQMGFIYKTTGSAPLLTSVAITGSPFVGSTLTAVPAGANETSFRTTYVWERSSDQVSWSTISNSNSTYTLVSADNSKYVRVVVTRINDTGSSAGIIATTTMVSNPPSVGSATITGTAVVGQTLTASAGTLFYGYCNSDRLNYQWQSSSDGSTNWTNVGSLTSTASTSTTLVLTSSEAAKYIRVQIYISNSCGSGNTTTSSATTEVIGAPTIGSATITGTAAQGQTLTATANSVTGTSVTTTYQWQSAATSSGSYTDISLATSSTYVLPSSQATKFIKVKITVTNAAGAADTTSSATTEVIGAPTIGSADMMGSAIVGQTLTAIANTVTGTSVTTTYQWQSASTSGGSYTDIGSATSSTYVLPSSQVTKYIKVKITVTNIGGSANATSYASNTEVRKATPTISGFANTEVLLSDGTRTITDPTANVAGTFSYSSSDPLTVIFDDASSSTSRLVKLGSATITATFTPTDTAAYNSTTSTMVLTVSLTISSPPANSSGGVTAATKADYIFSVTKSRRLATKTLVDKLNAQVVKDRTKFLKNKSSKFSIFGTSKNVCEIRANYLVPLKTGTCELWVEPTTLDYASTKYWVGIVVKK
jgi:hypothetical protein